VKRFYDQLASNTGALPSKLQIRNKQAEIIKERYASGLYSDIDDIEVDFKFYGDIEHAKDGVAIEKQLEKFEAPEPFLI
jgi:hypothetical protein